MEELLSLKWNNHRSTFIHVLGILRDKQLYTDATLACDGKFYSVHKLVLSTCSDYFSAMLDRTNCKSPVIVLKDIKCEDLEALLDYMYLGEVNVRQSDLATLIKAAECLRVKGLAVPDDEPPASKKRETQTRRNDPSSSPPAKRKRRNDVVDDGRDDVRPARVDRRRSSSPARSSSRPKSPAISSTPLSPVNHHRSTPQKQQSSSNSDHHAVESSPKTSHSVAGGGGGTDDGALGDPVHSSESTNNQAYASDQVEPYVKVEMDDGSGADLEAYDLSNDGAFKEEGEDGGGSTTGDGGGDLSNDLPEFLQQATGPMAGGAFGHSSFSGSTSFQPGDLAGWQGDGSNVGFPHLNFSSAESASQQNAPGASDTSCIDVWMANATSSEGKSSVHHHVDPRLPHLMPEARLTVPRPSATVCPLQCPACGKLFEGRNKKQNLKHHYMTHTGERRYACPFCGHRTAHKWHLKTHVMRRHPDRVMESTVAWLGFKTLDISDANEKSAPSNVENLVEQFSMTQELVTSQSSIGGLRVSTAKRPNSHNKLEQFKNAQIFLDRKSFDLENASQNNVHDMKFRCDDTGS
ncbi:broad-complex core protein isoforms 1/2/3/4/5 isoform X3 [Hyalella azteca]|uniref:Broad-complex core protein isoforms 1/2/3/4/5 isoform X3 n=1 Tax=Hyalella azteca TaxID=294128 RepID=A0A8B7MYY0_HYAAZ|nr:broad-complex core protein isoforms 1/2/3/4/5 isoform X3 [Hyalella azteca]